MEDIIMWLLKMLLKTTSKAENPALMMKINEQILKSTPSFLIDDVDLKAQFRDALLNKKYFYVKTETTPAQEIKEYVKLANFGNNTFKKQFLYRELRKNKDPVIKKLDYRLKRRSVN